MTMSILEAVIIGIGGTLCIDGWALLLKKIFGMQSLNYCFLGRWAIHMLDGKFAHASIAKAPAKSHECAAGWTAHYSIGIAFAMLFLLVAPEGWLEHPTLLPALIFGVATVIVPFFTMQPAFGLGIAASKTPDPMRARLKSLGTHTVFGIGLYLGGMVLGIG